RFTPVYDSATDTTHFEVDDEGRWGAFKQLPTRDYNNWTVGATYAIPLGNRASKSAYARARLAVDQSNLQLEATKQSIRVEVRKAARDLESAARRVATTRANVELQKKKLDAEQKKYENGLSTAFQVLTYQTDLRTAESYEISAITDYSTALVHLARVRGTLLEDRGVKM
ncbi:MAG TPA: TolC family protein, partial [Acidobacteriota bacterium]|nr:TolC family protein [Acidobacteriota bacterium]